MKKFLKFALAFILMAGICAGTYFVVKDIKTSSAANQPSTEEPDKPIDPDKPVDPETPEKPPSKIWDGSIDTSWYDPNNPQKEYTIYKPAQLAGLSQLVSDQAITTRDVKFKLANDLYLNDPDEMFDSNKTFIEGKYNNFNPIGPYGERCFAGTFDGQGYSIYGLYQNSQDINKRGGLFGDLYDAKIYNLNLHDSYISSTFAGTLADTVSGNVEIDNVHVYNSNLINKQRSGGLIGCIDSSEDSIQKITNCTIEAKQTSTGTGVATAAGLISYVKSSSCLIKNIDVKTNIKGGRSVGGLSGYFEGGLLDVDTCNINLISDYHVKIGMMTDRCGISGLMHVYKLTKASTIKNCKVTGNFPVFDHGSQPYIAKDVLLGYPFSSFKGEPFDLLSLENVNSAIDIVFEKNKCDCGIEYPAVEKFVFDYLKESKYISENATCAHIKDFSLGEKVLDHDSVQGSIVTNVGDDVDFIGIGDSYQDPYFTFIESMCFYHDFFETYNRASSFNDVYVNYDTKTVIYSVENGFKPGYLKVAKIANVEDLDAIKSGDTNITIKLGEELGSYKLIKSGLIINGYYILVIDIGDSLAIVKFDSVLSCEDLNLSNFKLVENKVETIQN